MPNLWRVALRRLQLGTSTAEMLSTLSYSNWKEPAGNCFPPSRTDPQLQSQDDSHISDPHLLEADKCDERIELIQCYIITIP
jgi:hypothetical protein